MKKVVIYTSDSCGYCHAAKDFLKQNKISFVEHNISKDTEARRELTKKGYRSVPLILVNDKEILGFDKEELIKQLNLK